MTNKERAEKIHKHLYDWRMDESDEQSVIFITTQLDEAVADAVREAYLKGQSDAETAERINVGSVFEQGFATAREKAAWMVENAHSYMTLAFLADAIRAMTFTAPGEVDK